MKARHTLVIALGVLAAMVPAAPAAATPLSTKKAIWGPGVRNGVSQFPIYSDLGAGIWEEQLRWNEVATGRPIDANNPDDPAYAWPAELDQAVVDADAAHIRVALEITWAPSWANGGRGRNFAPEDPVDYAAFARAAARRYPTVHLWIVWGEPSRAQNFMPLTPETRGSPLNAQQAAAPHLYARILDRAYGALKSENPLNLVVGGNSFTTGDISPLNWIKNLRLPSGQAPRMTLYGHNPFSARKPNLRKTPLRYGFADFSDLDTLAHYLDKYLSPKLPGHKRLRIFISEFLLPTDHQNFEFNFYVSKKTQASWLKAALHIARTYSRIYTLGWLSLYDDPPTRRDSVNRGLIQYDGTKKPSYDVYRQG